MSSREQHAPGAAFGAEVQKEGEKWTLIPVRDLRHAPAKVWKALTDPEHLREWAPFDSDRNLGDVGPAKVSWVGALQVTETQVKRADAPKVLELRLGGQEMLRELEPWEAAALGSRSGTSASMCFSGFWQVSRLDASSAARP